MSKILIEKDIVLTSCGELNVLVSFEFLLEDGVKSIRDYKLHVSTVY